MSTISNSATVAHAAFQFTSLRTARWSGSASNRNGMISSAQSGFHLPLVHVKRPPVRSMSGVGSGMRAGRENPVEREINQQDEGRAAEPERKFLNRRPP